MLTRYPLHSPWRSVLAVAWTLLVCLLLLQPGRDPLVGPAAAGDHSPPVVLLLNLGHFVCFAVMTWLWWRALAQIRPALLIALTCGLLTELAQTFVPDRGLSALDLALNAGGALLVALWLRRRGGSCMSRVQMLALLVTLLLFYFALRLHHLLALPLFGDETLMAERAESLWQGHVLWFARESKLLGVWWLALFGPPLSPWLLRAGMLLLALPGTAALLTLARRLFGRGAILPAGVLLAGAPMLFFFERMALADTSLLTPLAILLLALERTLSRPRRTAALLAGVALAAAIMAKATALALLPLPLLALWWLPRRQAWRERRKTLVRIYGTTLLLWLPLLALLRLRNIDFLGAAWRIGGAGPDVGSVFQRLLANSVFLLQGLGSYFGAAPLLLATLLMLVALLAQRRRAGLPALASLLALGTVTLTGSTQLSMRYWLLALPPALLLCAGGLVTASEHLRARGLALLPWLMLALWLATQALPFMQVAWHAPAELPLPRPDRLEYIEADSAGTMLPELAALLMQEAQHVEGPLAITGAFAQCNTLALYLRTLPEAERIALDCPRILSPGERGDALDAHITALAQEQEHYLVIFEDAGLVPATDVRSLRLVTLAQLPRPGGLVVISVYRPELP